MALEPKLASVISLSSLVKMKKLVLDHFGKLTNDELDLIFALPYKLELCSTLLYETLKHIEDEDSFLVSLKERNVKIRFCMAVQDICGPISYGDWWDWT